MKLPSFQFYPGDWLKDTRALSLEAKGAWIDILVVLWDAPLRGIRGHRLEGWARILGCSPDQADVVLRELSETGVAEIERTGDGIIVIACRRMVREHLQRARDRDRKAAKPHEMWGNDYLGQFSAAFPALLRLISAEIPSLSSSSSSASVEQQQQPDSFGNEPGINRQCSGAPPPEAALPSEQEVVAFGAAWPGDLARGVPGPVPAGFCREYHHAKSTQRTWRNRHGFLIDWQRELTGPRWWTDQWRTWSPAKLTPEAARKTRAEREADRLLASLPEIP